MLSREKPKQIMHKLQYNLRESIRSYVNCIMTGECIDPDGIFNFSIYADGYPGLMFQKSELGFYLLPKKKRLSELFLYGQTLQPVTLAAEGTYQFSIFQLYPFASKYLLNVNPRVLNDDCYDLLEIQKVDVSEFFKKLNTTRDQKAQIEIMSDLVEALLAVHCVPEDDRVQMAIDYIIDAKGRTRMSEVQDKVALTERTLERNFLDQVGLTPKQFARIIQFQSSLERLGESYDESLTSVGLESGFSDQSHFIRVFKNYTGLSPSQYLRQAISGT